MLFEDGLPSELAYGLPTVSFSVVIDLSDDPAATAYSVSAAATVLVVPRTIIDSRPNLTFTGGAHWRLEGGFFRPGANTGGATLTFHDVSGSVFVEGVRVDHVNAGARDGLVVTTVSPNAPDVFVQNCRFDTVTGGTALAFGTVSTGPLGTVKIDRLTVTGTGGAVLADTPDGGGLAGLHMRYVNVTRTGPATLPAYRFYASVANYDDRGISISLHQVWVRPDAGMIERYEVRPNDQASANADYQGGTAPAATFNALRDWSSFTGQPAVSWPNIQASGKTLLGEIGEGEPALPPSGDFVPADTVGLVYVTPGYAG